MATDQTLPWRDRAVSERISMRQLEAFDAVATAGSITAGAAMLNLSQPSVTRLIADLEHNVGFALFRRIRKRLEITPEGKQFQEDIQRSFSGLDRLTRAADDIRNLRTGRLRLAVVPALTFGAVPHAIAGLHADSPDLGIVCEQRSSEAVLESVLNLDSDLGVALDGAPRPGLINLARFRAHCVCIIPKGHPLAVRDVVELADLRDYPRIALPQYTVSSLQLNKLLADAGIDPKPQMEVLISYTACALVAEGIGISILDPFTARTFKEFNLEVRPFLPKVDFGFRLVHSERKRMSLVAEKFYRTLIEEFEKDPLVTRLE